MRANGEKVGYNKKGSEWQRKVKNNGLCTTHCVILIEYLIGVPLLPSSTNTADLH